MTTDMTYKVYMFIDTHVNINESYYRMNMIKKINI